MSIRRDSILLRLRYTLYKTIRPVRKFFTRTIQSLISPLGIRLTRSNTGTVNKARLLRYAAGDEDPFCALYVEADQIANPPAHRDPSNFGKQCRFFVVYQMAKWVIDKDVPGDFMECGCLNGHSTYIIATVMGSAEKRTLWVFDSFEGGLSEKHDEDRAYLGKTSEWETLRQKRSFESSYEHVKSVFSDLPFVRPIKGWIPDVLSVEPGPETIAFAHIDVDLYEPTLSSLEFVYSRLSQGGIIVVDDYGSAVHPGATMAVDEFRSNKSLSFFLENHLGGCVLVK